jgi:putative transposase
MNMSNIIEPVPAKHATHKINVGSLVVYEAEKYEVIAIIDHLHVTGKNLHTFRHNTLSINRLQLANLDDIKSHELSEVGDENWQEAQRRFAIIQPLLAPGVGRSTIEAVAVENGVFFSTLYRWINKYKTTGTITSLIPQKRGVKLGYLKIDTWVEGIIESSINDVYLSVHRPSIQHTINEVMIRCKKAGVTPPHPNTIRNRIANISEHDRLISRGQRKKAKDKYRPAAGSFPGADYPLAVVQIDHTPLDIMIVDDTHRQSIGRPYITLAMDIYSRMITGYYLSLEAPNSVSVAMCISQSILHKEELLLKLGVSNDWPVFGIPAKIHLDNAAEFKSETLQRACATYNITTEYRMPGAPQTGGHIERVIGTIIKEIHNLPGTTFSNIKERDTYQSEKHAIMTLTELEKWLVTFITGVYHQRIHTELHMPPLKQWEIGIFGDGKLNTGTGIPLLTVNPNTLMISFLPLYHRTIQTQGVAIEGLHYYADVLRQWIKSKDPQTGKARQFVFRRDPRDISAVWFYDPSIEQYFRIPCSDQRIPAITHWEYQNAIKQLKLKGINSVNLDVILESLEELKMQAHAASQKTKQARRSLQRIKEADNFRQQETTKNNSTVDQPANNERHHSLMSSTEDDLWDNLDDLKPFDIG